MVYISWCGKIKNIEIALTSIERGNEKSTNILVKNSIIQGIDALYCRQPKCNACETYANKL